MPKGIIITDTKQLPKGAKVIETVSVKGNMHHNIVTKAGKPQTFKQVIPVADDKD